MIPKFRVFDSKFKEMEEVYLMDWQWPEQDAWINDNPSDDLIFMQSTGIKDKNGVEIYEGDILKLHAIFLATDDKIGYLEYSPKYGYSIIFEGNRLYRQEYWASTNKLNYEVIGNIWENEDLLNDC